MGQKNTISPTTAFFILARGLSGRNHWASEQKVALTPEVPGADCEGHNRLSCVIQEDYCQLSYEGSMEVPGLLGA